MSQAYRPECEIQEEILNYLLSQGIWHFRMPVTGIPIKTSSGQLILTKNKCKGMADIQAYLKTLNKVLWIEVKSEYGKLSPAQISFKDSVVAEGHAFVVARSVDDVKKAIETIRSEACF